MSWIFYYLLLGLLFAGQMLWKQAAGVYSSPDLLFCMAMVLALVGKPGKFIYALVPAAILRASVSLDPTVTVFACFLLIPFVLREICATFDPNQIPVQFALAFLGTFFYFVSRETALGGSWLRWNEMMGSALVSALCAPLLVFLVRRISFFHPLLDPR